MRIPDENALSLLRAIRGSKSQLRQDLFVLAQLNFKTNGFFVEFGTTNGVDSSNTYLLEKEFGWRGILAEPARSWHPDLYRNRNCAIETDCVWRESNSTLAFREDKVREWSTIECFAGIETRKDMQAVEQYQVRTISLLDLLVKYNAPKIVDYLSIDTEGSECEILEGFDFERHQFRVVTCEHNYLPHRESIHALLTAKGYLRLYEKASAVDDWYVNVGLL